MRISSTRPNHTVNADAPMRRSNLPSPGGGTPLALIRRASPHRPHHISRSKTLTLPRIIAAIAVLLATSLSYAADGLIAVKSPHSAKETMDRLEKLVGQRGLNVFLRIDHSAGAAKIGTKLRPTELLVFGNPQGGTPFMECAQSVGIDLPLKALVWEDSTGQVWLGYNDPEFLARRHEVPGCPVAANMRKALAGIAEAATAKQ